MPLRALGRVFHRLRIGYVGGQDQRFPASLAYFSRGGFQAFHAPRDQADPRSVAGKAAHHRAAHSGRGTGNDDDRSKVTSHVNKKPRDQELFQLPSGPMERSNASGSSTIPLTVPGAWFAGCLVGPLGRKALVKREPFSEDRS
ncbi:hypothetical protein GCM10011494_24680 [Novosphingobium endophyticum]|uniref:Uncharacterized protein n=1 Tax=Novosphingobium endophyticum TaxID=1955250 RepID=A0A916TVV8_9SPHN|nr:hypothetical protein GCM10011494_24680 [Novosphingobium endophyticum]